MEDIEKRSQQCVKVLTIVLVGRNARMESRTCLWQKPFTINCQQLCGFLSGFVFASNFKGDLLRLSFGLTAGAVQLSFRLCKCGALFATSINWNANAKAEHVVGAKLSRVSALPHVLDIEVRVEILVCKIDLQFLPLNHLLRARNLWVLCFRSGQEFFEGIGKWRLGQFGGFYVRRGLRAVEKLLDLRLRLSYFKMVHGDFAKQLGSLNLRL